MTAELDSRYLELFPAWLRSLGQDAKELGDIVAADDAGDVQRYVVAGLNYLFKSLDLIPDGIDDLGFMDDAFVLRLAAAQALEEFPGATFPVLRRLADETKDVAKFLEEDYPRLEAYVKGLRKGAARGRTVDDILRDAGVRAGFVQEVAAWSKAYEPPSFTREIRTLIKLKAFLSAKLS